MFRAILTFATLSVLTAIEGVFIMTLGLILPARWLFDPFFRVWSRGILTAAGVRLYVEGAENIPSDYRCFFAGNHQSALDIPLMAVVSRGHARFMAKRSLFQIPWFGWILSLSGFIPVDRGDARKVKASVDDMLRRLQKRPIAMVVFPEGTRSRDGSLGSFKHGSLNVCRRAGMPIVPFAIDGSVRVHKPKTFRIVPGVVRVAIGEPIATEQAAQRPTKELAEIVRGRVAELLGAGATGATGADASAKSLHVSAGVAG